jgi:hypothetical protein
MIDTDKYEGHTPAPWKADYDFPRHKQIQTGLVGPNGKDLGFGYSEKGQIANAQLIADAPLLLAEVIRLRGLLDTIIDITLKELRIFDDNCPMINIRDLAYKGIMWGDKHDD